MRKMNVVSACAEMTDPDKGRSAITTFARTIGGSAALGLIAAAATPAVPVIVGATVIGLVGGYFAKYLDKPQRAKPVAAR